MASPAEIPVNAGAGAISLSTSELILAPNDSSMSGPRSLRVRFRAAAATSSLRMAAIRSARPPYAAASSESRIKSRTSGCRTASGPKRVSREDRPICTPRAARAWYRSASAPAISLCRISASRRLCRAAISVISPASKRRLSLSASLRILSYESSCTRYSSCCLMASR